MKKIFLSIFAVALMIVACNKEEANLAPTALELEEVQLENSNVDTDAIVDSILERWGVSGIETAPKSNASSSRTSTSTLPACVADARTAPSGATNYISYELFTNGDSSYGLVRSEDGVDVAAFTPVVSLYFVQQSNNVTFVYVGGSKVNEFTSAGFDALYAIPNALAVELLTSSFVYVRDSSAADAGLACSNIAPSEPIDLSQFYTVIPAPFPLSGYLATMRSGYADMADWPGGTSLNYAASSISAVEAAIEANIADGN